MLPTTSESVKVPATAIRRYVERLLALWQNATEKRLPILFFAGLALICGMTAFIGAVPTRIFGHDIFIFLDNGWRVLNGQRPHLDFTSPWGPVIFLISAAGLTISGHSVNGIGYGSAIAALIIGFWAFSLSKNRLAASPRLVFGLFLAALVASPHSLGFSPFVSSHAMIYNRYGYALLGLLLLESFQAVRDPADEWLGGLSTGAALGLALFLKASFFFMGGCLVVVTVIFRRQEWKRWIGLIVGFGLVCFGLLAYLRFDLGAMLGDLRMAAGARSEGIKLGNAVWGMLNNGAILLGVLLFCFPAALLLGDRSEHWRGWRLPLAGLILFGADIGLLMSNAQGDCFPLCAIFAILIVNEITEDWQTAGGGAGTITGYAAVLCLGALLFVPQFTSDLAGLGYGALKKARPSTPDAVLRFTSPNLAALLLYDGANPRSNGRVYTTYVNDGVALLEREGRANATVLTMDLSNPFSFAMESRPPRGGIAAPAYHYSIGDGHKPSDEQYFGEAEIVMVPKRPALDDIYYTDFYKAYEPGLKQRYDLAAESDWWWMYRRKPVTR